MERIINQRNYQSQIVLIFIMVVIYGSVHAEVALADIGKINFVEGHFVPDCRQIEFVSNSSGKKMYFRIKQTVDDDNIQSVALAAPISNSNVLVAYDDSETTGCGSEQMIRWIRIYR